MKICNHLNICNLGLFLSLNLVFFSTYAQSVYKTDFEFFNRNYEFLNQDSSLRLTPDNNYWSRTGEVQVNLDFPFQWGEYSLQSLIMAFDGSFRFLDLICDDDFTLMTVFEWDIKDPSFGQHPPIFESDSAHGGIFMRTTGSPGSRKTTFEWFRAASNAIGVQDTINFQIIFYQGLNRFEYHFEDITVSPSHWSALNSSSFEPAFVFASTPDCDDELNSKLGMVYNDGTSPDTFYYPWRDLFDHFEDSLLLTPPVKGTVWGFTLVEDSVINQIKEVQSIEVNVYPNPTDGRLFISNDGKPLTNVQLTNLSTGVITKFSHVIDNSIFINHPGIYLLTGNSGDNRFQKKIVVR